MATTDTKQKEFHWRPMVIGASALILLTLVAVVECSTNDTFKRICYIRPDLILPFHHVIQNDLCTHIIVCFSTIDSSASISSDEQFFNFCHYCKQIINHYGSTTKLLFSIGGKLLTSETIIPMIMVMIISFQS